jgi:coenzyme F420-reducing hydrogenase beta subunit
MQVNSTGLCSGCVHCCVILPESLVYEADTPQMFGKQKKKKKSE